MFTKCTIQISIRYSYPAAFTEVLADDPESTEVALESSISLPLLELFGEGIIVEGVTIEQSQSHCKCAEECCCHA